MCLPSSAPQSSVWRSFHHYTLGKFLDLCVLLYWPTSRYWGGWRPPWGPGPAHARLFQSSGRLNWWNATQKQMNNILDCTTYHTVTRDEKNWDLSVNLILKKSIIWKMTSCLNCYNWVWSPNERKIQNFNSDPVIAFLHGCRILFRTYYSIL